VNWHKVYATAAALTPIFILLIGLGVLIGQQL
jgi:hypothetical protein